MNPESKIKHAGKMNIAVLQEDDGRLPLFPDQNWSSSDESAAVQSEVTESVYTRPPRKSRGMTGTEVKRDAVEEFRLFAKLTPDLPGMPWNAEPDSAVSYSHEQEDSKVLADGAELAGHVLTESDVQTTATEHLFLKTGNMKSFPDTVVENIQDSNGVQSGLGKTSLHLHEDENPVLPSHEEILQKSSGGEYVLPSHEELLQKSSDGDYVLPSHEEILQSVFDGAKNSDMGKEIGAFREQFVLPGSSNIKDSERALELSSGDWGEELLVLLPELQELTDRGNFVTGRANGDFPELHEILGKLTETSEKLERISSVMEKFEQEYRT